MSQQPLFHWEPLAAQVAILRAGRSIHAPVLLTLFPPKPKPGEQRGWSTYYPTTAHAIRTGCSGLLNAIRTDWCRRPQHSLGLVVNEPMATPDDWRPGTGNGQAWGSRNDHISQCWWLFAECDRDGLELAQQAALAEQIYGAPPSMTIATGGRSLHAYYRLSSPVSPDQFRTLQRAAAAAYLATDPDCAVDRALCNPARVLRAAGGGHPRTGQLAHIRTVTNTAVCPEQLLQRLQAIAPPPPPPEPLPVRSMVRPLHLAGAPAMDQIIARLESHPPYASGKGQREEFRRFAAGLRAAVLEAGGTDADALELVKRHSPGVLDVDDYWRFQWKDITAGSFWFITGGPPKRTPDLARINAIYETALQGVGQ